MLAKRSGSPASHDDIFGSFFDSGWPFGDLSRRAQQHRETFREDAATLEVDLPGVKPADVDVNVEGSLVKVRYSRGQTGGALSWQISEAYDIDGVTARMEHGVLSLDFPKAKKARGRKIEVRAK